ncbi:MAG: alpha/beta hydrolase, partial [Lewinella sp.]
MFLRLLSIVYFLSSLNAYGQTPQDASSQVIKSGEKGKNRYEIRVVELPSDEKKDLLFPLDSEPDTSQYGAVSHYHILPRKGHEAYRIRVTLPPNYSPQKTYPTVYYLDSWWLSEIVLGTNTLLTQSQRIEPMIFVGVSNTGGFDSWNKQRLLDFSPSKLTKENTTVVIILQYPKYMSPKHTGNAASFLDFLENTIISEVEANYAVKPGESGVIGHSFSGLFGYYSLQAKPDLFKKYLLISPSMWWEAAKIVDDETLEQFSQQTTPHEVFISYGTDEPPLLTDPIMRLDSFINNKPMEALSYKLVPYENRNHNSVIP